MARSLLISLLLCLGLGSGPAWGAAVCGEDCVAVGQWQASVSIGVGYREQVVRGVEDTPLVLLPSWSYYGRRFYLNNLELGFSLWETPSQSLSLVALPGYEQMYFNRFDPLNFLDAGGGSGASASGTAFVPSGAVAVLVEYQPEVGPNAPIGTPTPAPAVPPAGEALNFRGVTELYVNGRAVPLEVGSHGHFRVARAMDGSIVLRGLSPGDQVEVRGASAPDALPPNVAFTPTEVGIKDGTDLAPDRDSIARRRMALLTGFDYQWQAGPYSGQLQVLGDASGVHDGFEIRLAASRAFALEEHQLRLTLGANYQTRRVLDYYYGLHPQDHAAPQYAFRVRSGGATALARLDWQRPINDHWTLQGLLQYRRFADEIAPSPLLEKHHSTALFVGVRYRF